MPGDSPFQPFAFKPDSSPRAHSLLILVLGIDVLGGIVVPSLSSHGSRAGSGLVGSLIATAVWYHFLFGGNAVARWLKIAANTLGAAVPIMLSARHGGSGTGELAVLVSAAAAGSSALILFLSPTLSQYFAEPAQSAPGDLHAAARVAAPTRESGRIAGVEDRVRCAWHGEQTRTFVCRHILETLVSKLPAGGFREPRPDVDPITWCPRCDRSLSASDGRWTEATRVSAAPTELCVACYEAALGVRRVPFVARVPRGSALVRLALASLIGAFVLSPMLLMPAVAVVDSALPAEMKLPVASAVLVAGLVTVGAVAWRRYGMLAALSLVASCSASMAIIVWFVANIVGRMVAGGAH